jgi:5'-nucleotidase
MDILVTNDDGDCEGLRRLLEAAKSFGKAYAIIPNRQRSAVSGAITLHKPLRLHKADEDVYSLNGTPCDCVLFAIYSGEVPKPDLVLSGINWGDNTGLAPLIGSGTLGACWQAALEGIPSIAFSLYRKQREGWRDKSNWGERKGMVEVLERLISGLLPELSPDVFFSVNLPEEPVSAQTARTQRLQNKRFDAKITKRLDPSGAPYFWIGSAKTEPEEGSDYYEVNVKGRITISRISLALFGR